MSQSEDDFRRRLDRVERALNAILAISIDRHLRDYPELGSAKAPKMEHILSDAGLSGTEIAVLLNKTKQAVSQNLSR
jgi:hypothetical protein